MSVTGLSLVITAVYGALLVGGLLVAVRQIHTARTTPRELLNPLFGNPFAVRLFTVHIAVVTSDLFLIGPWALAHKSQLWYWGGRVLLLTSSLPIAAYLNRTPQTFGPFIGRWIRLRNFFEYGLHILFAALPLDWFRYYLLLWWLVAYRYLDVAPRRMLQRLYGTPAKQAERPWAPYLNWAVIVAIYVGAFLAIYFEQVAFARVPGADVAPHVPARWEIAVVVGANFALALWVWITIRKYTDSLLAEARGTTAAASARSAAY